jgi:hypothetical protein
LSTIKGFWGALSSAEARIHVNAFVDICGGADEVSAKCQPAQAPGQLHEGPSMAWIFDYQLFNRMTD